MLHRKLVPIPMQCLQAQQARGSCRTETAEFSCLILVVTRLPRHLKTGKAEPERCEATILEGCNGVTHDSLDDILDTGRNGLWY
jgi:hypothetical protein